MSQPPNTTLLSGVNGTNSRMVGDRLSVRFPSRIVPISVREPIGLASPFRTAMVPAMVVVLTAPSPTRRMPSLPSAPATGIPLLTVKDYIIRDLHVLACEKPSAGAVSAPDGHRDDRGKAGPAGALCGRG